MHARATTVVAPLFLYYKTLNLQRKLEKEPYIQDYKLNRMKPSMKT